MGWLVWALSPRDRRQMRENLLAAGLPLTVKGDGTIEGQVQIVIGYTLGLASVLLSMSTLWAGCAAVSAEIVCRVEVMGAPCSLLI